MKFKDISIDQRNQKKELTIDFRLLEAERKAKLKGNTAPYAFRADDNRIVVF